MKYIFLIVFYGWLSTLPFASALEISSLSEPKTSGCDGGVFSSYIYGTNPNQYLYDVLHTSGGREGMVSSNSSVQVYTTPKFSMTPSWKFITNYFPGNGSYRVIESESPVTLNLSQLTPADVTTPVAQVVYGVRRGFAGGSLAMTLSSVQYVINDPITIIREGLKTVMLDPSSIVQDYECQNIYPRWCGDALVTNGEVCDPNDSTRTGWGVGGCSLSCQPVTAPACVPGILTGLQPNPVTATTPGLCPTGQVVGDFSATTVGTVTSYTWSCNGSAVGGLCTASYDSTPNTNFDLRIKKYVKSEDIFAGVEATEDFNYNIIVENRGTGATSGVTSVIDILPPSVTLRAVPTGNGWTCTGTAGATRYNCTTNSVVSEGQLFSVLTVPVRVTNLVYRTGGYTNTAFVHNQNEARGKGCFSDNHVPTGDESQCTQDTFNADPANINPPNPTGYDLRLKKFVNGDDISTRGIPGNAVGYSFVLQNLGIQSSTGVITVTDHDFTGGITLVSIAPTQGEWTCALDSGTGFTCTTSHVYASGEYSTPIAVAANIPSTIAIGAYQNVACLSNAGDPDEGAVLNPSIGQFKNNNCDPALVVIPPPGTFDLMLKKYVADITTGTPVNDGDHQTATVGTDVNRDVLTTTQGGILRYRFVVTNLGYVTATGITIVEDTLPDDVILTNVTGPGWSCTTTGGRSFTCSRLDTLIIGGSFPEIVVNAQPSLTIPAGFYSNIATLRNASDTNPNNNQDPANIRIVLGPVCGSLSPSQPTIGVNPGTPITYTCTSVGFTGSITDLEYQIACGSGDTTASWSGVNTRVCTAPLGAGSSQAVSCGVRDRTNPSVIFTGSFVGSCSLGVTTTTSGGGPAFVGKRCINGIPTCANYNTLATCMADGIPAALCYSADAVGYNTCQLQALSCPGGGGGGGGGGGACGNGVLEPGEQCDIRGGASWCKDCQIILDTNPGSQPIDFWISIPTLVNTILGRTSNEMEMPFRENSVIIGNGSHLFTLADIVRFGIQRDYAIPVMVEYEKDMCLQSSGDALNSRTVCTTFGKAAESSGNERIQIWTHPMSHQRYVILGMGDFQYQEARGGQYILGKAMSRNSINLFHGSKIYGGLTLRDAFIGQGAGTNGQMHLGTSNAGGYYNFLDFPVRVSGAIVGTTGTPVNRSIQAFIYQSSLQDFIEGLKITTSVSQSTAHPSGTSISPLLVRTRDTGDRIIQDIASIPLLNGNESVGIVKSGNLTIQCPPGRSTIEVHGVKTIIVENGNLMLRCNLSYASNDTSSSIAWIVKGGDILVDNGNGILSDGAVTNLVGVFVAIKEGEKGGNISYSGNNTTQKILRLEGSFYGNASPLFQSRLYARGTSTYDILTTGTIVSYSNRALINPPPLLSQYLNAYHVERVVQ